MVFSTRSLPTCYKQGKSAAAVRTQCIGVLLLVYPVPGGNKYKNLALQVGAVSNTETVKFGHESNGTQAQERWCWQYPATTENYRSNLLPVRAPRISKPVAVKK
jgi:hypothetical protein